jgi:hypothetical protein
MKRIAVLSLLLFVMSIMSFSEAPEHIFQLFSDINEYHRLCYSQENQHNQKILNRLLSLPYENIGFSCDNDNFVTLFDNNGIDTYSSSNAEISQEIVEYITSKFLPDDFSIEDNLIIGILMKRALIEKVDPNSCGLFGNEYYVTLELEILYTDNDEQKHSVKYSKKITELVK